MTHVITKDYFRVTDYGAMGNGTANDTTAVQNAINAAAVNGGMVYFPPGTYMIGPLTVYRNVEIHGAGPDASTLKANASGTMFTYTGADAEDYSGGFYDITLHGNDTGTNGLSITPAPFIKIVNVRVRNFTGTGAILNGAVQSRIINSSIYNNTIGIQFGLASGAYGSIQSNLAAVRDTRIILNSSWNVYATEAANILLDGCDLSGGGTIGNSSTGGVYFQTGSEYEEVGLHITDGWFEVTRGKAGVVIDTPAVSNIYHIIENTNFVVDIDSTYGIYVEGASTVNKLLCKGVGFREDASGGSFYANGANATIVLDNCDGTTGGSGTITIDGGGGGGTVTSVASGTGLTGGPITTTGTLSLADTTVTPGSYTYASITVDQQGRITAASNGTSPTASGKYRQWLYSATGGNIEILTDTTGNPLTGLCDLE